MKKDLTKIAGHLIACVLMGAAMMGGMRAVEWYVPKPDARVVVCAYYDLDELECRPAAELLRSKAPQSK